MYSIIYKKFIAFIRKSTLISLNNTKQVLFLREIIVSWKYQLI